MACYTVAYRDHSGGGGGAFIHNPFALPTNSILPINLPTSRDIISVSPTGFLGGGGGARGIKTTMLISSVVFCAHELLMSLKNNKVLITKSSILRLEIHVTYYWLSDWLQCCRNY